MTLRARIALVVAAVVTVTVVLLGALVQNAADRELREEVDADLLARTASLRTDGFAVAPGRFAGRPGRPIGRTDAFASIVSFDASARVLDANGELIFELAGDFADPISANTVERVLGGEAVLSDGLVDGVSHRLITVATPNQLIVQMGRPLTEVETAIADFRGRVFVLGLLAVLAAAAAAWVLARRTAAPIMRLSDAAERVAATGDLSQPIEGSGGDEVGRLAQSFTTMLGALDLSRRQQRQLVMDASHELRTPLTSLRTNADVLRRFDELSDDQRAGLLDDVDAEVDALRDLVAELVDLAADVRTDEPTELLSLHEIAEPVVERARRRSGRVVRLSVEEPGLISARPEALGRAIRNLIDNALKFSPASEPVDVRIKGGSLTVHDNGPGIPPDQTERVQERFSRLEATQAIPGSGLGLAIVRQVVDAHDGKLSISTSPLGGAAVGFEIPTQ